MDFSKEKLSKEQIANAIKITTKARDAGIDPEFALALAWNESKFINQDNPTSGAVGIMQVMPANAKGLKLKEEDLHDPDKNIDAGITILKENLDRYDNNKRAALVAYNASPKTADKYIESKESFDVLPEETRGYLENIHSFYPLSNAQAEESKNQLFQRPKAEPIEINKTQVEGDGGNFVTEHPGMTGLMGGTALGIGEQAYKYGRKDIDKAVKEALDKELTLKAGDKWASKIGGVGGDTVLDAAKAIQLEKKLAEGETLTRGHVALPPGVKEKLEQEMASKQKIRESLRKGVPFYDELVDVGGKMARGASKVISRFAPISTGATGLIGGSQLGEAGERFKRGDIKGGLLSGLAGTTNLVATQPFFPAARGAAGLASIPLDIADVMYDPEQYSVVKEYNKKKELKAP